MHTSPISLFHQILLFIEDHGSVTTADLQRFGSSRQTLGALGRLEGLRYIERHKNKDGDEFVLTDLGDEILADLLSRIPTDETQWDGKWRMILFDVPETKRSLRQFFRMKLTDFGARMVQSSVWVSPFAETVDKFRALALEHKMDKSTLYFEGTMLHSQFDIAKLWDFKGLEQEYKTLYKTIETELPKLKKSQTPSFDAKCLIVALSLITKKDPYLTQDLMPKNWIGYQSSAWYNKLRIFCQ